MSKTIYIIPIEPIETRYTGHWYYHIPKLLTENIPEANIVQIAGDDVPALPTPGAFLDFGATNIYKSSQLIRIAELFRDGTIKNGDKFLFTDAWNTCILQVKYMAELLGVDVELHGLWHAGSYDPQDFLGRLIGDKPWVRNTEVAIFHCLDYSWFATEFHRDMFLNTLFSNVNKEHNGANKAQITGWPMEYQKDMLSKFRSIKENIIVFPHRLAPEKQLEIFKALSEKLPKYAWVVCQEKSLTKAQYHKLLGRAKMVFSANLQETLGIGVPEGMAVGAYPLVPDRLSYSEMYHDQYKYPSHWSEACTWEENIQSLSGLVEEIMENYEEYSSNLEYDYDEIQSKYFSAGPLIDVLKNS